MTSKIELVRNDDLGSFEEIEDFIEEGGLPRSVWMKSDLLSIFVIRDRDGGLAATVKLERNGERAFIEDLVVRSDLRNKGLGREIIQGLLEEAKKRGFGSVWTMARAHGFFRKLGFKDANDPAKLEEILRYCRGCNDYRTKCNPELLKKEI